MYSTALSETMRRKLDVKPTDQISSQSDLPSGPKVPVRGTRQVDTRTVRINRSSTYSHGSNRALPGVLLSRYSV